MLLCILSDIVHDCDREKRSGLFLPRSDTNTKNEETGPAYWHTLVCMFYDFKSQNVFLDQSHLKKVCNFSFFRFCVATAFYGISFNVTGFGLNIYLTQFTYAVIELPAKISVYFLLDKIGRRSTEVGALLLVGVCLGINIMVPKGGYSFISRLTSKPLVILLFKII